MKVKNRTAAVPLKRRKNNKARVLMRSRTKPTMEAIQDILQSATEDELAKARELIARGLARAKEKSARTPEEIWTEFEEVRARIATNFSSLESAQ